MKKPVIGITLDLPKNDKNNKYSSFPWYALRKNYADAVLQAGGMPIFLAYDHNSIENIISIIDGLIIPGGDMDIHPKLYNQKISLDRVIVNEERTNFELVLLKAVKAHNIPFLGICNGMQLLNVSFGGDLIQHIPAHITSDINHEQPRPKHIPSHIINIKKDTKLHIFAEYCDRFMVNSTHHQAVNKLGSELIASAFADDGIIEAIEAPDYKFMIGVEWHPEYLQSNPLDFNLFKGVVAAAVEK